MVKSKIQIAILLLSIISLVFGIITMLQMPTVTVSPLYLAIFYTFIVFVLSFLLGLILKKIIKSSWHILTFASIFVICISLTFIISQYKPTYKIIIPDSYSGTINLIMTGENENDFDINNFGIGYITEDTYYNGFYPKIIKNGKDITKDARGFSRGSFAFATPDLNVSLDYLKFEIPGNNNGDTLKDFDALIKVGAIETARIKK